MLPLMFINLCQLICTSTDDSLHPDTTNAINSPADFRRHFNLHLAALNTFKHKQNQYIYENQTAIALSLELTELRFLLTSQLIKALNEVEVAPSEKRLPSINHHFVCMRETHRKLESIYKMLYGLDDTLFCTIYGWEEFNRMKAAFYSLDDNITKNQNRDTFVFCTTDFASIFDRESVFETLDPNLVYDSIFREKHKEEISIISNFFERKRNIIGVFNTTINKETDDYER